MALSSIAYGEVKILDYTSSRVVAIDTGSARIQSGTVKLVHVVDIDKYEKVVNDIQSIVYSNVSTSHSLYPFLSYEIEQLQMHIDNLKPRNKRSLDFIGSAWKWVAGNPDHADFEIIEQKINNALQNSNRQVVINKMSLEKLNELTLQTNKIFKSVKGEEIKNSIIDELKYKLQIIKNEISNLKYAIDWAKVGVINSFILSKNEMDMIRTLADKENITYLNIEESLDFGEIRIASNANSLIYIINIPTTYNKPCSKIIIKPVKINKITTKIEFNEILICDKKTFGIKNKCQTLNKLTVCKDSNIEDISESECIPKLIRSKPSNCTMINNLHIATIEEIIPGTILLNKFNGTILIGQESYNLNGTYLIKFHNETLSINGKTFSFSEISFSNPLPAIVQPLVGNPHVEETLTLELIKEMNANNTEAIELLNIESRLGDVISYVLVVFAVIVTLLICLKRKRNCRKEQNSDNINIGVPWPLHNITFGQNDSSEHSIAKITQIPYF